MNPADFGEGGLAEKSHLLLPKLKHESKKHSSYCSLSWSLWSGAEGEVVMLMLSLVDGSVAFEIAVVASYHQQLS